MLLMIILLLLFVVVASGITTIPFSVGLLVLSAVLFKKSWMFFLAFGLGLFLDLISIRVLGSSSLVLAIFVFILFLYERKFEIQTVAFVFISTFLGSIFYLWSFEYQMVFLQAFINALLTAMFFQFSIRNFQFSINKQYNNI